MYNVSKVSKTFGISKIFVAFILVLRYRIRSFVETIKNFTVMNQTDYIVKKIKWYCFKNIVRNLLIIARNLVIIYIEILLIVEGVRLLLK